MELDVVVKAVRHGSRKSRRSSSARPSSASMGADRDRPRRGRRQLSIVVSGPIPAGRENVAKVRTDVMKEKLEKFAHKQKVDICYAGRTSLKTGYIIFLMQMQSLQQRRVLPISVSNGTSLETCFAYQRLCWYIIGDTFW
ncbi:hypothetical protein EJB05_14357, partial [Eragrostis curvula]